MEDLEVVQVKKVAGPIQGGAAIFLGNEKKTFVIYVGIYEANAIIKEIQDQKSIRPLTHDLMYDLMLGFDVAVKQVIITDIIDQTFCATLVLEQKIANGQEEWLGRRNEVRIDARASDSIVVALKSKRDILVSRSVFDQVDDITGKIDWESIGPPITPSEQEVEPPEDPDLPFGEIEFEDFNLDDED